MSTATIQKTASAPPTAINGDDDLYEIINGERVVLPMSYFATLIASRLFQLVGAFLLTRDLGHWVSEGLFYIPQPADRDRRPDLAFVSYQRWPKQGPFAREQNAWDVVPDLGVEVVSPNDTAEDLQEKIEEYFRAGMLHVWVVYPLHSKIYVYQSPTQVQILTPADELDGGTILPGFRLALSELFPPSEGNGTSP